ncbi:hypothetical protein CN581_22710 [Bacillus toyonensis]|uniref:hypothetical protein n=1 Tax=Bacillus toyonensis TaxID=155322 RepID=UPI000BF97A14|nr:hypothetical protein [Bacillus toyonensis]PEP78619.1 hypothetical protein CN581_22710 [Bacillus toyonensis]
MKKVKKFAGVALAGAIGLSGLGLMETTAASAEENNLPTLNSVHLSKASDIKQNSIALSNFTYSKTLNSWDPEFDSDTAGFGGAKAGDTYNFTVEPIGGGTYSYMNFWMDKYSSSNRMTFEVYKDGYLIQRATSQGQYGEVRGLQVTRGTYTVKVFDPTGSNNSSVHLRARLY